MVKIKQKKQFTLPQLIEWAWENGVKNKEYVCNEHKAKSVIFNLSGWAKFSDEFSYSPHDTFTVEVEEELTEDTFFKHMIEITDNDIHLAWKNTNITTKKCSMSKEFHAYIDDEYKLIWRDGKLVE